MTFGPPHLLYNTNTWSYFTLFLVQNRSSHDAGQLSQPGSSGE